MALPRQNLYPLRSADDLWYLQSQRLANFTCIITKPLGKNLHGLNGLLGFELAATLTGILGGLGLILAIIGVYGVMSYSVSQRTQEIGIRIALGAQRGQILGLVGKQGFLLIGAGLLTGTLLAFAVGQIVQEFLVGVGPADPLTYLVISLLLTAAAMAACFVPARRAVRVDPITALRNQ